MNNFLSPIYTCATRWKVPYTKWPQTFLELKAVFHEKIKTNIH